MADKNGFEGKFFAGLFELRRINPPGVPPSVIGLFFRLFINRVFPVEPRVHIKPLFFVYII